MILFKEDNYKNELYIYQWKFHYNIQLLKLVIFVFLFNTLRPTIKFYFYYYKVLLN